MSCEPSPTSLVVGDDSLPESLPIAPVITMPAKNIATNNITIAMIRTTTTVFNSGTSTS